MPDHAPFRADQVGSLLRPPALKAAREQHAKGEISAGALTEIEDRFIREAVKKQEATGIQAITDGDFRRTSWSGDFLTAIDNVEQRSSSASAPQESTPIGGVVRDWQPPTPVVTGKLGWPKGGIQRKSFEFLKSVTTRTPKVMIPSLSMLHFRGGRGGVDKTAYPEMEQFFADAIAVYRAEIMDLAAAGCRYVQLDDTNLAYLCDTRMRERVRSLGEDPDQLPHLYARLINDAIKDRPADMKITVHLCRGNSLSRGHAEGGYEPVAEAMFNEVKIDGFFLEYDDARSGDFAPLRFVPKGKLRIVLGVITSKFG
ncbi:MAG TPA: 5-methyltetrahydropteroyltriglutamate--homocysteine S-methyltransferase, partial [Stellaceae bacterium]|nr:5-methyltetrahydropteroyltriglutamate--homocysteine S-methyltransferase [Stellaceae bacterium]